ncbi:MAG: hypothetical protein AB7I59_01745 [Geminicoccaceae bacterium]
MSENTKRSVTVRFEREVHERLQALSQTSGENLTELVRNLVERALKQDSSTELLARSQAIADQLDRLEHNVATHLPALHQRLGTLEQLVCAVDANAIRRAPVEHMKLRHLWRNQRYALFELQDICCHLLQQTMHTNGHKLAEIEARYAECMKGAEDAIAEFVPEIRELMAELDADAPPPLQPPPPPALPPIVLPPTAPSAGEDEAPTAANIPVDGTAHDAAAEAGPPGEQPSLFAGNGAAPTAASGAGNGSTEVAQ